MLALLNVNAFKARLDKFWQQQLVKFDFTQYRKPIRRNHKVIFLFMIVYIDDADSEVSDTCVRNSLLSYST